MKEDFLHICWRYQLFYTKELKTCGNLPLQILKVGKTNIYDGPDFREVQLKIGNTIWAGNVEIHLKSSDWLKHGHQNDERYQNIILHIVWENDVELHLNCETLELKGIIPKYYLQNYKKLMKTKEFELPCRNFVKELDVNWLNFYREKIILERFSLKSNEIENTTRTEIKQNSILRYFFYGFGLKGNEHNFLMLSNCLEYKHISKLKSNLAQLNAYLFGQAGFLNDNSIEDKYYTDLRKEYFYLKEVFNLESQEIPWLFLRIRPIAFPTLKIAFIAHILHKTESLENFILTSNYKTFKNLLRQIELPKYWENHYTFKSISKTITKKLGDSFIEKLWINTVLPLRYKYASDKQIFIENISDDLKNLKKEDNKWTRLMVDNNYANNNAYQSQFNLHLYKTKCFNRKCLNCDVGIKILKKG